MSNVYIRSQNREKLYQLGGNYATLEYVEYMKKGAEERHTIRIGNGCTEEIAEYESKERCIEVLDEIEKVCSSIFICSGQHGAYQRQHAYAAYGNGYTEGISDAGEVRAAHGRIQRGSKRVLPSIQTITEKAQLAYAQQI